MCRITRLCGLAHIVKTLLHERIESIVIRQFPDIWIVVVGDQSFQIFISLEDSEEPNQIAVVVIDDFFFNRLFPQEHLCAAHAGFHIGSVGRHERIDGRIDTPLVSSGLTEPDITNLLPGRLFA